MIVLGLDTATGTAAVGLVDDHRTLADVTAPAAQSHVACLPALIEAALARAGIEIEAVDAVAVSIGPGSFTGLRIGLALAKGLVFAGGLRLALVPTLEALAAAADAAPGTGLCAALDARKGEVYAAFFEAVGPVTVRRLGPDEALAPDQLAARLGAGMLLLGDAAAAYPQLGAVAQVRGLAEVPPRGSLVARLGWHRLAAGETVNPGEAEPVYVRAPEAELVRAASR